MLTKHVHFRMAVEFYMTNGRFLAIGLLACSNCKIKSLKGLDFSNSYILPESGHPLNPLPSLPSSELEATTPTSSGESSCIRKTSDTDVESLGANTPFHTHCSSIQRRYVIIRKDVQNRNSLLRGILISPFF